jgi:hypothetical protein
MRVEGRGGLRLLAALFSLGAREGKFHPCNKQGDKQKKKKMISKAHVSNTISPDEVYTGITFLVERDVLNMLPGLPTSFFGDRNPSGLLLPPLWEKVGGSALLSAFIVVITNYYLIITSTYAFAIALCAYYDFFHLVYFSSPASSCMLHFHFC